MYSLTIGRYGRHLNFESLEELKEELSTYFTAKDKASGIVDRLTTFTMKTVTDSFGSYKYAQNNYQDFSVGCYEY